MLNLQNIITDLEENKKATKIITYSLGITKDRF